MEQYVQPKALLKRAESVWFAAKEAETRVKVSPFEKDVMRILALLNLNTVESKVSSIAAQLLFRIHVSATARWGLSTHV